MSALSSCREVKVITVREEPFPAGHKSGPFDSPESIVDFWRRVITRSTWFHEDKEHLVCICLDTRYRLKSFSLISMGSLNEAIAHPREIFRPAIVNSAHSIIVMHNHCSGDPNPSRPDLRLTRQLYLVAELLQIPLLDHVIIGDGKYFSFREVRGLWPEIERDAIKLEKTIGRQFTQPARATKSNLR